MFSELLLDDAKNFNTKMKWVMKIKIKKSMPKIHTWDNKKTLFVAVNTRLTLKHDTAVFR